MTTYLMLQHDVVVHLSEDRRWLTVQESGPEGSYSGFQICGFTPCGLRWFVSACAEALGLVVVDPAETKALLDRAWDVSEHAQCLRTGEYDGPYGTAFDHADFARLEALLGVRDDAATPSEAPSKIGSR